MEKMRFTLIILAAVIFTSCSKDSNISEENSAESFSTRVAASTEPVITGWERGYSWSLSDSSDYKIYAYNRSTPEITAGLLNGGTVLVYAKNVPSVDGSRLDKPMLMPFHVLPSFERPGYDQVWYNMNSVGNILVKYRTNKHKYGGPVEIPDAEVQFRYFIITQADLSRYNHTANSIARLTYTELTQLLGAAE